MAPAVLAPDPSIRTLEQLSQAVKGLREVFETRFTGYDEAIKLLQSHANREPTPGIIYANLMALKESVEMRFRELDIRTSKLDASNKTSIDLALQAAKEAAQKSEMAFNKQIDALSTQIAQATSSLETRINDTKERLTIIEAGGQGQRQGYGVITAVIGVAVSLVTVAVLLISKLGGATP